MIYVYIDESGNLGRSGKFFTLAAVVFDTEKGKNRVKRIIKKEQVAVAEESKREKDEIKFCQLTFAQRQRILNKIVKRADVDIFYFVAHKPKVNLLNKVNSKNLVYNYFAWLLCECIFKKYNDHFTVIFDQRSTAVKSMNSLTDYITVSAFTLPNLVKKRIIVNQADSKTNYLLQAADVISGSIYQAYTHNSRHYINIIKNRIIDFSQFPKGNFLRKFDSE